MNDEKYGLATMLASSILKNVFGGMPGSMPSQSVVEQGANFLNKTGGAIQQVEQGRKVTPGLVGAGAASAGGMSANVVSDVRMKEKIKPLSRKEEDDIAETLNSYDRVSNSYFDQINELDKYGPVGSELKEELAREVIQNKLKLLRPGKLMENTSALPKLLPNDEPMNAPSKMQVNSIPDYNRQRLRNTLGLKDSSGVMGYKPNQSNEPKKAQELRNNEPKDAFNTVMENIMKKLMASEGIDEFDLEIEQQSFSDPKSTGPDNVVPSGRADTSPIVVSGSKQDVTTTRTKKSVKGK